MPDWWKELVAIPNVGDPERLAQTICTSFEVPQVRCETLRDHRVYCTPCPKMHPKDYVPVRCHLPPALSRLLAETTAEDPGLYTGPSILGREGQSTSAL